MPVAGNLIDRSHQIHRWLSSKWITPYPTELKWVAKLETKTASKGIDKRHYGEVYLRNRKLFIRLSKELCGHNYDTMIKILIHEYAHAMDWRHCRMKIDKDHPRAWGMYYADIYDSFYDGNGYEESIEF